MRVAAALFLCGSCPRRCGPARHGPGRRHPCCGSSLSTPTPRSACHRPRCSVDGRRFTSGRRAARSEIQPQSHPRAAGPGFWRRSNGPRLRRQLRGRRTSGTKARSPDAPSTAVPSGCRKTPTAASPATASPADRGRPTRCRTPQSPSKGPPAPRLQAALSSPADGRANPRLNILIAEKAICPFVAAPHRSTLNASAAKGIMTTVSRK